MPDPLVVRVGRVVLPREHGGWSLVLEPLVLGLVAAPSVAGGAFAAAALSGFFLRRPLKLVLGDQADSRRPVALGVIGILAVLAIAGVSVAVVRGGPAMLWPLALAGPAGVAFAWWDARGEGREGAAEVAGATAFAMVPAVIAMAGGWPFVPALALAAIMAGRSVPTVMTIRAYLRQNKGQSVPAIPALVASGAALAAAVLLVRLHLAPWMAGLMAALLLVRAVLLLGPARPRINASRVGLAEAILGGILIVGVALGWSH